MNPRIESGITNQLSECNGDNLMSESHTPYVPEIRNPEHERWLAMQAAYQKYISLSAALDLLSSQILDETSCMDEWRRIERVASEQRNAFESYVEARMQYSEFQLDRDKARIENSQCSDTARITALPSEMQSPRWAGFTDWRLPIRAAALALVCVTAFSLVSLVRDRVRLRDSAATRNEIRAAVTQTCAGLQALMRKIDALSSTHQSVRPATMVPGSQRRVTATRWGPRSSADERLRRFIPTPYRTSQKQNKISTRGKDVAPQVLKTRESSYYAFTLPISKRFKRVGPLKLSLRKANADKKYLDLCISADNFRFRRVKLFEPVQINLSDPSRRVHLVVNRIDKNHVRGYLTVRRTEGAELAAG
jgi:hypothetical protein